MRRVGQGAVLSLQCQRRQGCSFRARDRPNAGLFYWRPALMASVPAGRLALTLSPQPNTMAKARGFQGRFSMSDLVEQVRQKYGAVAASRLSGEQTGVQAVARAFGYSAEELASIPAEANMALSCGNPTATANLKPGEVVVDLGCGGGIDVFLAARKVGPTGKAIGIDMTPEMIDRAKRNAEVLRQKGEAGNI